MKHNVFRRAALAAVRARGVPIGEGHGDRPWDLPPALDAAIRECCADARDSLRAEWRPEFLCAIAGANAIGIISDDTKTDFVLSMGAKGVINRNDFKCWGQLPPVNDQGGYGAYMKECRKFGAAIWAITGKGNDVDFVFEHPGEQTFPVSCFVVKRGGMVVFCAGTTGYNLTFDARFVWMRQKRIQGSHFANLLQAAQANQLVIERRLDPCMSEVFSFHDIPRAHTKMWKNQHKPGNMAVLVQAKRPGLRTLEDAIEA